MYDLRADGGDSREALAAALRAFGEDAACGELAAFRIVRGARLLGGSAAPVGDILA